MSVVANPYLNRTMIRDINDFYGRRREVSRIYSRIGATHPQSVSIVGPRRIGKSSLLYFIYQEQNREKYLKNPDKYKFIFIDFQERKRMTLSEFFSTLFELLSRELHDQVDIVEKPDYDGFKNVMEKIQKRELKLILLFDEFDSITQNPNFGTEFFAFLRAFANRYDVAYVMSSGQYLQELCHTKEIADSPFFNIFSNINLNVFSLPEARELITTPSKTAGIILEPYVDFLIEISSTHPFFLQIACSVLFEYLQFSDGLDDAGREEVCENIIEEAEPHFTYIWQHIDEAEQQVCMKIIKKKEIAPLESGVLRDLIKQGYVLENSGEISLFSSLFARWITESSMKSPSQKGEYAPEAIVVIDICGSSRIADRLGAHRLRALYDELKGIAIEVSRAYHDRYHRATGDGFLFTFHSIMDAVNASLEIQRRVQDHNRVSDEDHRIPIRFSVHFGETLIDEEGNRHGPSVNMAFKVESLDIQYLSTASGHQLPLENYMLVTEHIANELVSVPGIICRKLGAFPIEGFTDLHIIYCVARDKELLVNK